MKSRLNVANVCLFFQGLLSSSAVSKNVKLKIQNYNFTNIRFNTHMGNGEVKKLEGKYGGHIYNSEWGERNRLHSV
jgi:hypothetical protein